MTSEAARPPRSAAGASDEDYVPDRRRWWALAVTQAAVFMSLLDVSIVNVSLPSIQRDLGASPGAAQWVVSGYALTFGLVLVPSGRLGDTVGRRRMFLIALVAFVATSALCGAAPSHELLVVARLLQGVAAGLLAPQTSGLIQELFRGAERGKAFGVFGSTTGLATAVGPVVGGLILAAVPGPSDWRLIFYVNVPIGLLALVLASRLVPVTPRSGWGSAHFDLVGSLLLGGGVLGLLLPLVDSSESGGLSKLWWSFLVAAVLFAAFLWWEHRTMHRGMQPLLDPRLARTPGYPPGVGIALTYYMGFTGIWLVFALFFQNGQGYSPLRSGLMVTPFALGVAVSAVVAGGLVARLGRWLTVIGLVAAVSGLVGTALTLRLADGGPVVWLTSVLLLVAGLGSGAVTSPNITLTLERVPVRMAGAAGGALQTAQRIGAAIGTAALASVFYTVLSATGRHYAVAISSALLCAAGFMLLALVMAIIETVMHRSREGSTAAPTRSSERASHHL
ncbi:MFS transporter [Saccharopolyspora sp. K220]|uniref:MFS transporter n=1 Tax=Saccharopolyspora soli TaxID=2926618 RepID=UPI001F5AD54B|nr:MFS transporter [Saccharopolyspora soli]MCI2422913.1 MFS transporter [Saccharopolyspora soli]